MMQLKSFRSLGAGAVLAGALGFSSMASAAPIEAFFQAGLNTFTDNNAELFINVSGAANTVDVGDIFLGAIEIDSINGIAVGPGTGNNELTGVFALEVTSVTPIGGGLAFFSFGAVDDLQGSILAATGVNLGPTPVGTFALFFEDATPDAVRDGNTFAGFVAQSADGTFRMRLTLDDGAIGATGFTDLNNINLFPEGFGLPISFFGTPGPLVAEETFAANFVGPIGISGNAQRPAASLGEDFTIRTDTTIVANLVPEPTTLGLFAAALLAFGFSTRRRNRS
jgi:hypothetical protein